MNSDSNAIDWEKNAPGSSTNIVKPSADMDRHFLFSCLSSVAVETFAKCLAEFIGTAMLMLLGCGTALVWSGEQDHNTGALGFGLAVMLIIQCFGSISMAHLNPAVTVCALIYRLIGWRLAIGYTIAQLIGAFVGYGLLSMITPAEILAAQQDHGGDRGFCMSLPHDGLSLAQALAFEFLATSMLVLVCCASWDPRNVAHIDSLAIKFGLSVSVLSMVAGPATGCAMNPARAFGPALWNNIWTRHWIYWVSPLLAAVVTTLIYQCIFAVAPTPKADNRPRQNDTVSPS